MLVCVCVCGLIQAFSGCYTPVSLTGTHRDAGVWAEPGIRWLRPTYYCYCNAMGTMPLEVGPVTHLCVGWACRAAGLRTTLGQGLGPQAVSASHSSSSKSGNVTISGSDQEDHASSDAASSEGHEGSGEEDEGGGSSNSAGSWYGDLGGTKREGARGEGNAGKGGDAGGRKDLVGSLTPGVSAEEQEAVYEEEEEEEEEEEAEEEVRRPWTLGQPRNHLVGAG